MKELADALGLAENAVRVQLSTMQGYGLVEHEVRRTQGAGKPAYEYRLTPQAQRMFPVAHGVILDALLDDIEDEMTPANYEERLRTIGRRVAGRYPLSGRDLHARLEETVRMLDNMGAVMELEEEKDSGSSETKFTIYGYSCPLGTIPQQHPQVCRLVETMIAQMVGVPVHEHCERGEMLACRLEVSVPGY